SADHRSDIFALGGMLYEMIAGHRAFQGKSRVELLNAIIQDPAPPIIHRKPELPPEIEEVLARALAKDPKQRYQHAGDFALDLQRLKTGVEPGRLPSLRAVKSAPSGRPGWPMALAAA